MNNVAAARGDQARHLPAIIEAFILPSEHNDRYGATVRAHRHFLAAYRLTPSDVPAMTFNAHRADAPFESYRFLS